MTAAPQSFQQITVEAPLAACPFCGGVAILVCGGPGNWFVRCDACRCSTDDTMRHVAIERWNARASGDVRAAVIEECANIADVHAFGARQAVRSATGPKYRQAALAREETALSIVKAIRDLSKSPAIDAAGGSNG